MRNDKTCKYCEGDGIIVYSSTDMRPCAICEGAGVVSVPSHRPPRESVEDQRAYASEAIRLEAGLLEGETLREICESAKQGEPPIKKGGVE